MNDNIKLPPQALETEMAVLGALMQSGNAIDKVIGIIDESCFFKESHGKIFSVMLLLFEKNEVIDVITVSNELKKQDLLNEIGGNYYLTECIDRVTTSANVEFHAKILKEKHYLRELLKISQYIFDEAYSEKKDHREILAGIDSRLTPIIIGEQSSETKTIEEGCLRLMDRIDNINKQEDIQYKIVFGLNQLDNNIKISYGNIIIIGAYTSVGKTTFALNIYHKNMERGNIPGIISLEENEEELLEQLMKISGGDYSSSGDMIKIITRLGSMKGFYNCGGYGLNKIKFIAKEMVKRGARLLFIDYLQIIEHPSKSIYERITHISRQLKLLAMEIKVPIFVLSQISRESQKRGQEPNLFDLKDSGSIENDTDIAILLYKYSKEELDKKFAGRYKDLNPEKIDIIKVSINKNRRGKKVFKNCLFLKDSLRFVEESPVADTDEGSEQWWMD